MLSILLDTQIILWWINDDQKLRTSARLYITEAERVFVSSISFWEMIIKKQLNKLDVPDNVRQLVSDRDFATLPFKTDHAFVVNALPLLHRDPFDRALIAQAVDEDFVLVTHDKIINSEYNSYVSLFDARS